MAKGFEGHLMRLQQFLARAGIDSRRKCETHIQQGRVSVNGVVVTEMGTTVDPEKDVIEFDGEPVVLPQENSVIMLNKPKGYLSAMEDSRERTVADLVPVDRYKGLFPIGRLDKDTTGVLLFTTDGELGHRLLHPSMGVTKRYEALVEGIVTDEEAQQLANGIELEDGMTAPARCAVLKTYQADDPALSLLTSKKVAQGNASLVVIEIHEGRKRQVRRMFQSIGHDVIELKRTDFGPINVGDLPAGHWRELTEDEIQLLNTIQSKRGNR